MVSKSGSEFLVNTTTAQSQFDSSVAALPGGRFVVTWTDQSQTDGDTSLEAVRGQIFDASGAKVGPEFLVNTTTAGGQAGSTVAALSTGGFVVTWTDNSQSDGDTSLYAVRGQIFDASGNKVGSEFLVNTTTLAIQTNGGVAALSNGGFVVTWSDSNGGLGPPVADYDVRGQVFDASGNRVGSEFTVNTTTAGNQNSSSVAALSTGGFVVTWADGSQTDGDMSSGAVRGQVFDAHGNKVGSEFLVNTTTAGSQGHPSVAALSTGGFVVTWEDDSQTDGDTSGAAVRGQVFDARGNKVGSEFLVNTTTAGEQYVPNVVALSNGGFAVTWGDTNSDVHGQVFDARGNKVGAEFLVNTATAETQFSSSAAALSGDKFVVTWTDNSQTDGDTSFEAVRGQVFSVNNTAPTAVDDRWLVSRSTAVTAAASVLTANDSDPDGETRMVTR